jgi:hypothetical protein
MANAADRALAQEKSLSAFRLSKSMHATLGCARRLMAIFRAIIHSCGGFQKHAMRKTRAKLITPAANRFEADDHTAFEQQFFDIA